jgi:hypothetical protein
LIFYSTSAGGSSLSLMKKNQHKEVENKEVQEGQWIEGDKEGRGLVEAGAEVERGGGRGGSGYDVIPVPIATATQIPEGKEDV